MRMTFFCRAAVVVVVAAVVLLADVLTPLDVACEIVARACEGSASHTDVAFYVYA